MNEVEKDSEIHRGRGGRFGGMDSESRNARWHVLITSAATLVGHKDQQINFHREFVSQCACMRAPLTSRQIVRSAAYYRLQSSI